MLRGEVNGVKKGIGAIGSGPALFIPFCGGKTLDLRFILGGLGFFHSVSVARQMTDDDVLRERKMRALLE